MNKQIEALKMVIEALEELDKGNPIATSDLLKACKEALAEAEKQEPVGVVYSMQDGYVGQLVVKGIPHGTKLYTHY